MKCAWQELLSVIPPDLRGQVDRQGRKNLRELRMRLNRPIEMITGDQVVYLEETVRETDISYVINAASRYSPWAAETMAMGYLSAPGGHRIGICGQAVIENGEIRGIKKITSLCIRVARDFPGIAAGLPTDGSVFILGPPGTGKTTLLRDLVRMRSSQGREVVCVVDDRQELFPDGCFDSGRRTHILSRCPKGPGMDMLLRCMGPTTIAVDEITSVSDCEHLIQCSHCGVKILATAHGATRENLYRRPIYQKLMASHIFDWLVILQQDQSWHLERMEQEC